MYRAVFTMLGLTLVGLALTATVKGDEAKGELRSAKVVSLGRP